MRSFERLRDGNQDNVDCKGFREKTSRAARFCLYPR